ncbi:MAG: Snf7 family protein [Candidatus Thorarchaeota archaeon]|nr:MAG: hypothetical protein DRO73_03940 [Candidatus Thorarchaeota archaeon]
MGFLSGKKSVDVEKSILDLRATINQLTLMTRRYDTRIEEQKRAAKQALAQGDREIAKTHLQIASDLRRRRARVQQQMMTLETSILHLEEARSQTEVLKAYKVARQALAEATAMLKPVEIQMELDRLSESFDRIATAGELLSEDLTSSAAPVEAEDQVERELEAMEAEILLEKEGMLPPVGTPTAESAGEATAESEKEEDIEKILAEMEREAKAEREKEAES